MRKEIIVVPLNDEFTPKTNRDLFFSSLDATPLKIHGGLGIMMENDGYRVLLTMHTQKG